MSLQDTFAGALAGGAISGLIGFLTTRYDRKLVRREAHLREHRDNIREIERALVPLKEQIWPLTAKGAEDLRLPRWDKPPLGDWLKKYSIADFVSVERIDNDRYKTVTIDPILYSDMSNHFPEIHSKLYELEQKTRTEGFKLGELTFEVTRAIYERISESSLSVLKWTLEKGERAPLGELLRAGSNEGQWYAGAIFLLLTGEDKGNWPNELQQLQKYSLLEGLERLAKEIKLYLSEKVNLMLKLRDELFNGIDDCTASLQLTVHKTSLKGGCEYL